jgi:hypothetical protein
MNVRKPTGMMGELPLDANFKEKNVHLAEGQYRVFTNTTEDGPRDRMVVKQINKRAVAIHPKDAPLSNEEIETASYCISPTARTMSGIITRDVFTVVPMPIEGDLRLTADQVNSIPANPKNHVVKLGDCYCCRPTSKNENTVTCCGCGSLFHTECAGNPRNLNMWQCEKHLIRTKGADWAADRRVAINTCPIDNHLTMFAELAARDPAFINLFEREGVNFINVFSFLNDKVYFA